MGDTQDQVRKAVAYGGLALGAFAVATPTAFVATYGLPATPGTKIMTRLWASRSIVLAALSLSIDEPGARRTLTNASAAMSVGDAALILTAGGVSASSRIRGALTAAAFCAANAYLVTTEG